MKLQTIDFKDPLAPEKFVESLRQTGFGVLSNHPLQKESILNSQFYAVGSNLISKIISDYENSITKKI